MRILRLWAAFLSAFIALLFAASSPVCAAVDPSTVNGLDIQNDTDVGAKQDVEARFPSDICIPIVKRWQFRM